MFFPTVLPRAANSWSALPAEIRNRIYKELYRFENGVYITRDLNALFRIKSREPIPLELARTNRQIYHEVVSYLLENNILHLDVYAVVARDFLRFLPEQYRKHVKSIVLEPLSTCDNSYSFNKMLCDCLANEMALDTLTIKVGHDGYVSWLQESRDCDAYIISAVVRALMEGKIKKVRLVYPTWYDHRIDIEKLIHIKSMRDSGIDLWLRCELEHSWRDGKLPYIATAQELDAYIEERGKSQRYNFAAVLGSAKDNENGTVVEITKEAEKRKCEVEDANRYQAKRRIACLQRLNGPDGKLNEREELVF